MRFWLLFASTKHLIVAPTSVVDPDPYVSTVFLVHKSIFYVEQSSKFVGIKLLLLPILSSKTVQGYRIFFRPLYNTLSGRERLDRKYLVSGSVLSAAGSGLLLHICEL
jgi:hypothetical protein